MMFQGVVDGRAILRPFSATDETAAAAAWAARHRGALVGGLWIGEYGESLTVRPATSRSKLGGPPDPLGRAAESPEEGSIHFPLTRPMRGEP